MSDYRRFISYLYEYRQGAKAENRGFVRVESRSGTCTLEIHMKLPALSAGAQLSTYGFVRLDSSLGGILFHRSSTGNGFYDARFSTEANHMGGSEYPLEQLGGLLIFSENGHCYGTAWDEASIQVEQFAPLNLSAEDSPEDLPKGLPSSEESSAANTVEASLAAAFTPAPEEEPLTEAALEPEQQAFVPAPEEEPLTEAASEPEPQAFVPVPEEEPLEEAALESEPKAFIPVPEEEQVTQASVPLYRRSPRSAGFRRNVSGQNTSRQTVSGQNNSRQGTRPQTAARQEPCPRTAARQEPRPQTNPRQEASRQEPPQQEPPRQEAFLQEAPGSRDWCADPRWFQVQQRYPAMQPFPDDTICECVRLDLKDLPTLRRDGWTIGSNRFVLHGFYSHRHLLLGRLCGRDGCCYVLGIPGFYDRQEQFMANSFGFPCFHAAALQNTPGRTFGYWYRPIS